ncbi:aryl-sulfate sulfotransferase [Pigmentiphaga aceris]|uniref:Aryl-sulfate sulfotransferase n=1 Tax=Pigmentiphaga aceris TaxID=1940612 RepID=A0A5C0AVJ2_9BURK|nr:ribbon-helix-helix domain-containing protein [Pigmentiphaga aceris]QEI05373.1 aryl-sulfate sulfotransferase [Pigmentiphaga aceris]
MCSIYSHTDPILYESRTRSIRIMKAVTSIKLENLFWQTLTELANENGMTTNQLIAKLFEEVYAFRGETTNFTSFLRVSCLRYMALKADASMDGREVWRRAIASTGAVEPAEAMQAAEAHRAA